MELPERRGHVWLGSRVADVTGPRRYSGSRIYDIGRIAVTGMAGSRA